MATPFQYETTPNLIQTTRMMMKKNREKRCWMLTGTRTVFGDTLGYGVNLNRTK
jgi:hypothetical protein